MPDRLVAQLARGQHGVVLGLVPVRATFADLSDHPVRLVADLEGLGVPRRAPG